MTHADTLALSIDIGRPITSAVDQFMNIFKGKDYPCRAGSSTGRLPDGSIVETDIPARLDRLPWGRFHTRVVVALGITWVLDGLEVTIAGAISGALKQSPSLHFSNADVGIASSAYLAGAVLGAIFFGWLTDRLGRKRLFFITRAVYLVATAATAFSWNFASFVLFRLCCRKDSIRCRCAPVRSALQFSRR
jgi:Major Facilitator Superfamily